MSCCSCSPNRRGFPRGTIGLVGNSTDLGCSRNATGWSGAFKFAVRKARRVSNATDAVRRDLSLRDCFNWATTDCLHSPPIWYYGISYRVEGCQNLYWNAGCNNITFRSPVENATRVDRGLVARLPPPSTPVLCLGSLFTLDGGWEGIKKKEKKKKGAAMPCNSSQRANTRQILDHFQLRSQETTDEMYSPERKNICQT